VRNNDGIKLSLWRRTDVVCSSVRHRGVGPTTTYGYRLFHHLLNLLHRGSNVLCITSFCITGSALALHCCKAHAKINWKIENSTPCKIVSHEDFNLKLGTRAYVVDITHHATFKSNQSSRGFPPKYGKYNTFVTFLLSCIFFGHAHRSKVALILTLNGSNDVFPPKDGPFWGHDDRWPHMEKMCPKTPQKGAKFGSQMQKDMQITVFMVDIETGSRLPIWRTFVFQKRK